MLKTETTVASKVQVQPIKADSRERIGIMGGTFNPPHLGHLIMAKQVQEQLDLDKVLFMPDNLPPHIEFYNISSTEEGLMDPRWPVG